MRALTAFAKRFSSALAVVFGDASNISLAASPTYWGNSACCSNLLMAAMATSKYTSVDLPQRHGEVEIQKTVLLVVHRPRVSVPNFGEKQTNA